MSKNNHLTATTNDNYKSQQHNTILNTILHHTNACTDTKIIPNTTTNTLSTATSNTNTSNI